MNFIQITSFETFCAALRAAGFSTGGSNGEGVFTLADFFGPGVASHTGDAETDPWEWRMRVLEECEDIAYAKVFRGKSGYITREWMPYFIALRRPALTFDSAYQKGLVGEEEKRVYDAAAQSHFVPLHELRALSGFSSAQSSRFERILTGLQMKTYLTMCGRSRKISREGEAYGWSVTNFCTLETFFGPELMKEARALSAQKAEAALRERIALLNPAADPKKVAAFLAAGRL